MAAWVEHAILWHVYPLGFVGAEAARDAVPAGEVRHRFSHLNAWLDYVVELGCSGLLLGPIFASGTHGYDTSDYYAIDPRLGDRADFDAFLVAAKQRGLRVILDGVFNHVGRDFPEFRVALEGGPDSPESALFRFYWDHTNGRGEPAHHVFEGHDALVSLNHKSEAVMDLVTDVMCHWLEAGIDGWRLDAAYAVPNAFWANVTGRVRARFPEAYILGEVLHGDYAQVVADAGFDAVTQYELWKATWSAINDRNFHELAWALARHDEFLDTFVPQTFVGNHDVTRIASKITDPVHLPLAFVVLFTVGGTPSLYYGDEQAYAGTKSERIGGDDDVRPVMPTTPGELSRLGEPTYRLCRELIGLRRRNPWLHESRVQVNDVTNESLTYVASSGPRSIRVVLNVARAAYEVGCHPDERCIAGQAEIVGSVALVPPDSWAVLARD